MTTADTGVTRTAMHRRNIDVQGYKRSDGLWDVEGVLQDTKGYDMKLSDKGVVPQGGYLHQMILTITIDDTLKIHEARAQMLDTPYLDCPGAAVSYDALVGLRIQKGWMDEAKKAVGRSTGCTHITEMLPVIATAAIQTIRGYRLQYEKGYASSGTERSGLMNTCHGFRIGGRAQARLWPHEGEPDELATSFGEIKLIAKS